MRLRAAAIESRENFSAGRRRAMPWIVGLWLAAAIAAAPPAFAVGGANLDGAWQAVRYSAHLAPLDGTPIPFTPEGSALYRKIQEQRATNPAVDSTQAACAPLGLVRTLAAPYPFNIVVTAGQVVIVYEVNRAFQIVLIQPEHNDPGFWDQSYMGDGIGHWDNDTLVIDSRNFVDVTWLDDSGLPHSSELHVVERLRALNTGKRLEVLVTIEDPKVFSRPWTTRLLFERRNEAWLATDWVCGEAHRDVSAVSNAKSYP
jgi:hypothetical protein